jgi:nitroreductase
MAGLYRRGTTARATEQFVEAYRAIVTKRDTRQFAPDPIPEDVLHRILQAGRMAGSAKNAQPVRLIVLRDPDRKAEIAACGQFAMHVPGCAVAVAIALAPEEGRAEGFTIFRGPFDAGRAAQNMMVAAWAEGVASCPASMHDFECARTTLGLPEGYVVANVIAFGYPASAAPAAGARPRLPLDDFVHWERW